MRIAKSVAVLALLVASPAWARGTSSKSKAKSSYPKPAPRAPFFPDNWKACTADADCMEMALWCLDTSEAINVQHEDEAEAKVKAACPRPGGMLYIPKQPACRAGRCELGGARSATDGGQPHGQQ